MFNITPDISSTGDASQITSLLLGLVIDPASLTTEAPEFDCGCNARNCGCDTWLDDPRTMVETMRSSTRNRVA